MPTAAPNLTRKYTLYVGVPSAASSGVVGGVGELSRSYSGGMRVPQCNTCGKMHLGECKRGHQGCYLYSQMDHVKRNYPRRVP